MKYIYELHRTMLKQNMILVYEGEFTQEVTKSILAMAERNMDSFGEDSSVKRKVFNVMVECLQNISKHAENYDAATGAKNNAIFMIGKYQDEYIITSGNAIFNVNVPTMEQKLAAINALDKEGLKELYKDIIKKTKLSEKGGAGLGFVDMARKSGHPLGYSFELVDETFSFFSLKTTISRHNN
jgi:Family of unknown function (DUF6272)